MQESCFFLGLFLSVLLKFTLLLLFPATVRCMCALGQHFEQMGGTNSIFLASVWLQLERQEFQSCLYTRPVLSLPFLWSWKLVCVPCTWQNVVADSHGVQAGRVSKPGGDAGEGSLGCASVLSRCPSSTDTLREAQVCSSAWPAHEVTAAAPEDLQAKSALRATLPQLATVWSQLTELLVFSAPWLSACWPHSGAFLLLRE